MALLSLFTPSFPLRERGLKRHDYIKRLQKRFVVPLAGTWIETQKGQSLARLSLVVPLAGTWIETHIDKDKLPDIVVVPLAGTWIETISSTTWIC